VPQPTPQATLAPGTMLERRYRIERVIGSGGYASVYKAIDTTYNVERAIKEVTDPEKGAREQFRLEADLLINHVHPNIPRGYNVFVVNNRIYFVMDFVSGKDLEELLNESLTKQHRPLDEGRVLRWAIAICGALSELHRLSKPIIHRDIKPANIKITPDDRPVLIDFGLAKLQQQQGISQTQVAAQGVSPGFAPPEQYMAKGRTDARTDVYGLGATLYACLTGRDPAEAPARLLAQTGVTHGSSLESPRTLNHTISPRTEAVILKALELSPSKRQQSAAELEQELRDALDHLTAARAAGATLVMPPPAAPQVDQQSARRAAVAAAQAPRQPFVAATVTPSKQAAGQRGGSKQQATAVDQRTGRQPAAPMAPVTPPMAPVASAASVVAGGAAALKRPAPAAAADTAQHRTLKDALPGVLNRSSGKHPIPPMTAPQPAVGQANGQAGQPLVASSGAQHPVLQYKGANERGMTAVSPALAGAAAAVAVAEKEQKSGKHPRVSAKVAAVPAPAPKVDRRSWIHLGTTPISSFGKWMLAISTIETLWGAVALSLGIISIVNAGLPTALLTKLGLGWLAAVAILSLLGGQALSRPIYRRGRLGAVRRGMQGTGLFFFSVLVHLVALWGATIFISTPGNGMLAVIAYIIFGLNVLVAGALSVYNILD
jgi:eukaryotic-like serine/threonine-protein kinase